eukprot:scaffold7526_cov258-Pinguiococcus_pyrenoidosus.AAC.2
MLHLPEEFSVASNLEILKAVRAEQRKQRLANRVVEPSGDATTDKIRRKFVKASTGKVNLNFVGLDVPVHGPVLWEELRIIGVDLEELWLRACGLGDEGICQFMDAIESCPNVKHIILSENKLGDRGLKCVGRNLHKCPRLAKLEVNGNKFTEEGERAFAVAIAKGPAPPRVADLVGVELRKCVAPT